MLQEKIHVKKLKVLPSNTKLIFVTVSDCIY